MVKLDRSRPYGAISGVVAEFPRAKFEQDGKLFDFDGDQLLQNVQQLDLGQLKDEAQENTQAAQRNLEQLKAPQVDLQSAQQDVLDALAEVDLSEPDPAEDAPDPGEDTQYMHSDDLAKTLQSKLKDDDLGDLRLEDLHWRNIRDRVEAAGGIWPGTKAAGIAFLRDLPQ